MGWEICYPNSSITSDVIMRFQSLSLKGAYLISLDPKKDERGYFARTFCKNELIEKGLVGDFVQCNLSFNHKQGTLRGLHFQIPPFEEVKIVSCRKGIIFDVIVDIRKSSPTFGHWLGIELSAANQQSLYIPAGFAHGFQTLTDNAEVFYFMGNEYYPDAARGIRFDDPSIGIQWPSSNIIISEKDRQLPRLFG